MSKQSDLAARAAKLTTRTAAGRPPAAEEPGRGDVAEVAPKRPAARAVPRAKPVRVSADLAPQDYRALLAYSAAMAEELGRAKVAHVLVIRALVSELNANPELQRTIRQAVATQLSD